MPNVHNDSSLRRRAVLAIFWLYAALCLASPQATAWSWPYKTSPEIAASALPEEARQVLLLIDKGGPFPYARDGIIFGNREGLLPKQKRGYYREYTVPTPGAKTRGARRIVTGGVPPQYFYYSDDHYASFRRIQRER